MPTLVAVVVFTPLMVVGVYGFRICQPVKTFRELMRFFR
jgi:hypothetical protein